MGLRDRLKRLVAPPPPAPAYVAPPAPPVVRPAPWRPPRPVSVVGAARELPSTTPLAGLDLRGPVVVTGPVPAENARVAELLAALYPVDVAWLEPA